MSHYVSGVGGGYLNEYITSKPSATANINIKLRGNNGLLTSDPVICWPNVHVTSYLMIRRSGRLVTWFPERMSIITEHLRRKPPWTNSIVDLLWSFNNEKALLESAPSAPALNLRYLFCHVQIEILYMQHLSLEIGSTCWTLMWGKVVITCSFGLQLLWLIESDV